MKKTLLLAFLLSLFSFGKAQTEDNFFLFLEQENGVLGDQLVNSYQVKLKYFVEENISINYSLGLKHMLLDDEWTFHFPMGVALLASGLTYLSLFLPEEVEFHIPLSQQTKLSPYINLLGLELGPEQGINDNQLYFSWGVGSRFGFVSRSKALEISVSAAYKGVQHYGHGWFVGTSAGFVIK